MTQERALSPGAAENYWYRRHLALYEWVAERCEGLEVIDMACGEGDGSTVLARHAARVTGVDADLAAHEQAVRRHGGPGLYFVRNRPESFASPCDAVVFLQAVGHADRPGEVLAHFRSLLRPGGVAYVSTPNVLARVPPGAEHSVHSCPMKAYRADEFRSLCEASFDQIGLLGLFQARKLRAHELAVRLGWERLHPRLGLTRPFYERFLAALSTADFTLREGPLEQALDFLALLR